MSDNRKPTALDFHVGQRIRKARKDAGLSQTDLANMVGNATFQSVQKWEGADARISAGRLWQIAKATGRSIGFFYADIAPQVQRELMPLIRGKSRIRESQPKAAASPQTGSHPPPRL